MIYSSLFTKYGRQLNRKKNKKYNKREDKIMYYIKDEGQKHHFLTFFGVFNSSKYLSVYLGTIIGLTGVEQLQSLKSIPEC